MDMTQYKTIVRMEVFIGLFSVRYKYSIGDTVFTKTPRYLKWLSEEEMRSRLTLEVCGASKELKGEWKAVYDKRGEVVAEYFPTEEEKERKRKIDEASEETLLMGAIVSSLGR